MEWRVPRVPEWCRWALLIAFAVAAAIAYIAYFANGMVVGDLIGLPGREGDIAVAQHYAACWLWGFALFQLGVAIAIFSLVKFGEDAAPLTRFAARSFLAALFSLPSTLLVGAIILGILNLLRRLSQ